MEVTVTEAHIARLVLGYLKEECGSAYRAFQKSSHTKHTDKYVPTRILGLNLIDIVKEYVDMYNTVQARLEATSYFSEMNKSELTHNKLTDQLLYLLNKIQYSRSSTPCSIRSPIREESEDESASEQTIRNESSQKITPDKQPPKKTSSPENILAENEEISEVLTQQLLKNRALHEKLAETINNVLNSPEKPIEEANKSGMQEAIKTVVERTEADPIFEKLIEEIMGVANERDEQHRPLETPPLQISPTKPNENEKKKLVEDQNNDAIQSIVVASTQNVPENPKNATTSLVSTSAATTGTNGEVIVFDGTFDNYLKTANTVPTSTQSNLFMNMNTGLLMMQPTTNYLLVNSQPVIDHDILSMPTVIVNEPKKSTKATTKSRRTTKPKTPVLKPISQPTSTAAEFLTNFSTTLIDQTIKHPLTTFIQPSKLPIVTSAAILPEIKLPPPPPPLPMTSPPPLAIREPLKSIETKDASKDAKEKQTPSTATEAVQRVTPKSASHVRNLDFSTPPKITSTIRKLKREEQNQMKNAVKTLFKQNSAESQVNPMEKPTTIPLTGKKNSWDEDLRQMIGGTVEVEKKQTPKKKKASPKKRRLAGKKNKKLNVTAEEAKLLEAALKTPIKNDVLNQEDIILNEFNKSDDSHQSNASKKLETSDKDLNTSATKTVLSPSKLNANKRTLVKSQMDKSTGSTPELVIAISPCKSVKDPSATPILKTPLKKLEVPKTPSFDISTASNFTPFTKVIDEHLKGVDLDMIQTPSFPITPTFPAFTPGGGNLISPYPSRSTDYSTSSSYYQPSDTEQNKSLEQMMIDECNRLENKSITPTKVHKVTVISDVAVPPLKSVVNENLREFNRNIIGKKNLKLLKSKETSSSSSCSSESSSDDESVHNDTVICKKRVSRGKDNSSDTRDIIKTVEIKTIETLHKASPKEDKSRDKEKLLNDLREKRDRVKQKSKPSAEQKKPVRRSKRRGRDTKGKYHIREKTREKSKKSPNDRTTSEEEFTLRLSPDLEPKKSKEIEQLKSPSDLEAENLITNLKERGIHLMHNKSPKKMLKEDVSHQGPNQVIDNKLAKVFETRTFEGDDFHFVHDERKRPARKLSDYDLSVLNRELSANVYVEAFDTEVKIPIKVTPFTVLLDLPPNSKMKTRSQTEIEKKTTTGKRAIVTDEESNSRMVDDDLMNFAICGETGPPPPVSASPRTSKKRKAGSEDAHIDKKSKTENCVGILKGIDVDVFLNNIHGSD